MKFKIDKDLVEDKGIVYVLELELEDTKLIKIGMTCRDKVEDRVTEILVECWKRYRYFPKCYVARYKKVKNPLGMEQDLHKYFEQYKHETEFVWGGSTEVFKLDVQLVKDAYDKYVKEGKL